jgi:hypothetical protein
MKRNNLRLLFLVIGFSLLMAVWTQSFSAERPPFYQGKTLTFIINYMPEAPPILKAELPHLTAHQGSP